MGYSELTYWTEPKAKGNITQELHLLVGPASWYQAFWNIEKAQRGMLTTYMSPWWSRDPTLRNYRKRCSPPDHSFSHWRCKCRTERQNLCHCILATVWSLHLLVAVNRCGLEHKGYFVRPDPWGNCPLCQESFLQGFPKVTLEAAKERLIWVRVKHSGKRSCPGTCGYIANYLRAVLHIFSLGEIQGKTKNGFGFNK